MNAVIDRVDLVTRYDTMQQMVINQLASIDAGNWGTSGDLGSRNEALKVLFVKVVDYFRAITLPYGCTEVDGSPQGIWFGFTDPNSTMCYWFEYHYATGEVTVPSAAAGDVFEQSKKQLVKQLTEPIPTRLRMLLAAVNWFQQGASVSLAIRNTRLRDVIDDNDVQLADEKLYAGTRLLNLSLTCPDELVDTVFNIVLDLDNTLNSTDVIELAATCMRRGV